MRHEIRRRLRRGGVMAGWTAWLAFATACVSEKHPAPPTISPAQARASIERSLPRSVSDRAGWTTDVYTALSMLNVAATRENACAIAAVIEQESGFRVDPVVPHLPAIAWREIDDRAAHAGVPHLVVHGVLQLKSSTGRSYGDRIDAARTEKELSDIYEDFIGAVPLGRTLFADDDPIRTRGPMQVHVAFAKQFAAARPYPYPVRISIPDEVFSRRGGIYFGVAHLLAYTAPYDSYRYRFADFNAGQFASRNAAFQQAVADVSGVALVADGALLPHAAGTQDPGATEAALRTVKSRLKLGEAAIHDALELGKKAEFEASAVYIRVFELADRLEQRPLPREAIPHIELHGPKLSHKLTTEWYANRVNERFERCVNK